MSDKFEASGLRQARPLRQRMETNELDFHASWTVNEEHLLKPYQELFGLSLDLERGKRGREETAEFVRPPGCEKILILCGRLGGFKPSPCWSQACWGPLKSFSKLFVILSAFEIHPWSPPALRG